MLRRTLSRAYPDAEEAWLKRRRVTMLSTVVGFLVLDEAGRFTPERAQPHLTRDDLVEAILDTATGTVSS